MVKSSIRKIFKRDKSPKSPSEEPWGELCTSKTPPQQPLTPNSHLHSPNSHSPQQTPPHSNVNNSTHSRNSIEYSIDRRISESSVERMSSLSRFSSRHISSSSHSFHSSPDGSTSPGNSSVGRLMKGVKQARSMSYTPSLSNNNHNHGPRSMSVGRLPMPTVNDVDTYIHPIEDYVGPVDCDEDSLFDSGSSGSEKEGHNVSLDINEIGSEDEDDDDSSSSSSKDEGEDKLSLKSSTGTNPDPKVSITSSTGSIPIVYEAHDESDSWSGSHHLRSSTGEKQHPLTMRYTNDETIDTRIEDGDDTVYSFKEEEESIIAPMSTDELEDKDAEFGRMETDESALDDEDYYRQDYYSMMTKSKAKLFDDEEERFNENVEEEREEEEQHVPSLSDRVLMSDEEGGGSKRLSSMELLGMTEPDLPVGRRVENGEEDYSDLYTDVSFPVASVEEDEVDNHEEETSFDKYGAGAVVDGGSEGSQNEKVLDDEILVPQDRIEQFAATVTPGVMLPEDSEFVSESNVSGGTNSVIEKFDIADSDDETDIGVIVVEESDNSHEEQEVDDKVADDFDTGIVNEFVGEDEAESHITDLNADDRKQINKDERIDVSNVVHDPESNYQPDNQDASIGDADKVEDTDNSEEEPHGSNNAAETVAHQAESDDEERKVLVEILTNQNNANEESDQFEVCQLKSEMVTDEEEFTVKDIDIIDSPDSTSPHSASIIAELPINLSTALSPSQNSTATEGCDQLDPCLQTSTSGEEPIDSEAISTPSLLNINDAASLAKEGTEYSDMLCDDKTNGSSLLLGVCEENNNPSFPTEAQTTLVHEELDPGTLTEAENMEVSSVDYQALNHSRSRSLSPTPHPRQTSNLDMPIVMERTTSLPVKWDPFPSSSPLPPSSIRSTGLPTPPDPHHDNLGADTPSPAKLQVEPKIDINHIIQENRRLRIKRQQLCESLGNMAQQFSEHENASSEKIFNLEQKIRALVAENSLSVVANKEGCYDAATVHRLSSGVMEQDKMLESKDKQISQLTLRLEVLKRTLNEKEEKHRADKKKWDIERSKFQKCLSSSKKKSLFLLQQELFESRAALNNALSDIDSLTAALESNNETLDTTVRELENLREFKARHSDVEVQVPVIPRTALPKISTMPSKASDQTLLQELNDLRDLVVASDGGKYHNLEVEIELLREEATASSMEAMIANHRIEQVSAELKAKAEEVMKLRQDQSTKDGSEAKPDCVRTALKDFSVVSDLEKKIAQLEQKLSEYEKSTVEDSKAVECDMRPLALSPSKDKPDSSETPDSNESISRRQAESPLTARKLFQPLRRGWAAASPLLIKNPLSEEVRDGDKEQLNQIIQANTEVMDKLKRDIIRIQSEKDESEFEMMAKMNQLKEENDRYASQVAALEKAFGERETGDKRISSADELTDDGSTGPPFSPSSQSEKSDTTLRRELDLQSKTLSLQRSITELESTQSHQEDEIERLKSELVKIRVTSQQEKDAALEQLREEVAIITAQKSALENQLIEINRSAGLLRDSLSDQASLSPGKTSDEPMSERRNEDDGVAGNDPILVAQVVMLENANRVLENSVNSLRSDLQQKLTPLMERVALLEEEKRIIEDEMKAKLECREMTITNLENSLQQLNAARFASGKKKRHARVDSPLTTSN